MRYPIVIHKDRKSGYGITVPGLPGCFSAGVTTLDGDEIPQTQGGNAIGAAGAGGDGVYRSAQGGVTGTRRD